MSRRAFDNGQWQFVVGDDDVTGPFMQVWHQPAADQDAAVLVIDNQGVHVYVEIPELANLIKETEARFKSARQAGNPYPNLDAKTVCLFASKLKFNINRDIYEILL